MIRRWIGATTEERHFNGVAGRRTSGPMRTTSSSRKRLASAMLGRRARPAPACRHRRSGLGRCRPPPGRSVLRPGRSRPGSGPFEKHRSHLPLAQRRRLYWTLPPETSRFICQVLGWELISIGRQPVLIAASRCHLIQMLRCTLTCTNGCSCWSADEENSPGVFPYHGCALPTELGGQVTVSAVGRRNCHSKVDEGTCRSSTHLRPAPMMIPDRCCIGPAYRPAPHPPLRNMPVSYSSATAQDR